MNDRMQTLSAVGASLEPLRHPHDAEGGVHQQRLLHRPPHHRLHEGPPEDAEVTLMSQKMSFLIINSKTLIIPVS